MVWIFEHKEAIWLAVSTTVAAAAAIAALTPSPKDDSIVAKIRKIIDLFGFNFGFAKNDTTEKAEE